MDEKVIHNHFEKDSNCQVFQGPISGCVFAMPGSVVHTGGNGGASDGQSHTEPAIEYLDREVRSRIDNGADAKYVLLPVKAAIEAGVPLPYNNVAKFNERYGCSISKSTWSRWINGTDGCGYMDQELNALASRFMRF